MRPTDEEIQEKYYTMPTDKAGGEQEKAQWEQANSERLKQQEAAKWARDHDPWNYVEDGDLPPYSTDVIVVSTNNVDVLVAELRCGSEDYWEDSDTDRFSLSWVKCWMHIPQRKR
jgi:hypothetical protein